ncbi:MAG: hypothetical protein BGO07_01990 [Alphaproteobacteria bacterium 40-19]|nr:MAG: hypothetical protein BGO07_01990 [Alphaproteobacteria bacterium 40-19]
MEANLATQLESGLSIGSLFWQADWVVKGVILGLVGASFVSWAIIFSKWLQLKKLHKEADLSQNAFSQEAPQYWEHTRACSWTMPFSYVICLLTKEMKRPLKGKGKLRRVHHLIGAYLETQRDYLGQNMSTLASIASVSPFVGLLGTVWGIMNSFRGLVGATNSVSAVAPGIAEALFATAIGLLVAIPAAVASNRLMLSIQSYMVKLESFAHVVQASCIEKQGEDGHGV